NDIRLSPTRRSSDLRLAEFLAIHGQKQVTGMAYPADRVPFRPAASAGAAVVASRAKERGESLFPVGWPNAVGTLRARHRAVRGDGVVRRLGFPRLERRREVRPGSSGACRRRGT